MSAAARQSERAALRRGWCPGALRPMPSGDGLIVRLRVVGALAPNTARAVVKAAALFGNGHIDLTARANLQIRGVSERTLPGLQAAMEKLGLIDADPDAEAARNILASPLAGLDPNALLDIRPAVAALDRRLRQDRALWRLPAKFGFVVDDGGSLSVADEPADIAFAAQRRGGETVFALRLAGRLAGHCAVAAIADAAARLSMAFLALRGDGEKEARRMKALAEDIGVEPILRAAGLDGAAENGGEGDPRRGPILGRHDLGVCRALGVGVPFGRLDAAKLAALVDAAESVDGELRLTPWRAVMIAGQRVDETLAPRLREQGFVLDENDPTRAVAACPGAPACANASTATQAEAMRLAPLARKLTSHGVALHVSGCAKGCARAAATAATLVGRNGKYDVVLDGCAGDAPALRDVGAGRLDALLELLAATPRPERAAALRAFVMERS
ncbi:MAG TPA: precorrin-3B synthase [Roseiarcus sp.]|nr:precorrin-3B synthase [Roseiarcus sp.]